MILTTGTKRVLIRFKQVHFPLQSWVFQCISQFLPQTVSLHFQSFFLRYFVVLCFSVGVLQKKLFMQWFQTGKKDWCDVIHIQQQPTMLLLNLSTFLYNNCLISRALIGSFLSSMRVQTDKTLIYASFQRFNFQLSNCQRFNNGILLTFLCCKSKGEKSYWHCLRHFE